MALRFRRDNIQLYIYTFPYNVYYMGVVGGIFSTILLGIFGN